MRKLKIVNIFLKRNISKTFPSILTLTTFLIILNILLGILFSTTGVLDRSVASNHAVQMMEIVNENDLKNTEAIYNYVKELEEVDSCFIDVFRPIDICKEDGNSVGCYNVIGVPKDMLVVFGVEAVEDKFMYLSSRVKKKCEVGAKVSFEEQIYTHNSNNLSGTEFITFNYVINGYYDYFTWDMFPEDFVLIDEETAMEIARGSTLDGSIVSDRVIVYVSDTAKMKQVEQSIVEKFDYVEVRYALKHTGELPGFTKMLIAISGVILIVLFMFCIFNINGNVKQLLNQRQRDIGLLSLFGIESNAILFIMVCEYIVSGIIAFIMASGVTFTMFELLKMAIGVDLFMQYVGIYVLVDVSLALIIFILISIVQVKAALNRINNSKMFKEFLK